MKLGEGEEKIAEYYFKGLNDVSNMSVLTNRRLVVVYGNAEENYPLSKIASVKIIFNRSWGMLIVGAPISLVGLVMLAESNFGGGIVALAINVVFAIVVLAIGGCMGYLGWKGSTQLFINQMGGKKHYRVRGKDQKLIGFMDSINNKLS
ncbi:MAG: hypothetical protein C0412_20350 [Flavobacterium sp.]|nr:hypothetical protein [Flavobacterium sp.]